MGSRWPKQPYPGDPKYKENTYTTLGPKVYLHWATWILRDMENPKSLKASSVLEFKTLRAIMSGNTFEVCQLTHFEGWVLFLGSRSWVHTSNSQHFLHNLVDMGSLLEFIRDYITRDYNELQKGPLSPLLRVP